MLAIARSSTEYDEGFDVQGRLWTMLDEPMRWKIFAYLGPCDVVALARSCRAALRHTIEHPSWREWFCWTWWMARGPSLNADAWTPAVIASGRLERALIAFAKDCARRGHLALLRRLPLVPMSIQQRRLTLWSHWLAAACTTANDDGMRTVDWLLKTADDHLAVHGTATDLFPAFAKAATAGNEAAFVRVFRWWIRPPKQPWHADTVAVLVLALRCKCFTAADFVWTHSRYKSHYDFIRHLAEQYLGSAKSLAEFSLGEPLRWLQTRMREWEADASRAFYIILLKCALSHNYGHWRTAWFRNMCALLPAIAACMHDRGEDARVEDILSKKYLSAARRGDTVLLQLMDQVFAVSTDTLRECLLVAEKGSYDRTIGTRIHIRHLLQMRSRKRKRPLEQ